MNIEKIFEHKAQNKLFLMCMVKVEKVFLHYLYLDYQIILILQYLILKLHLSAINNILIRSLFYP